MIPAVGGEPRRLTFDNRFIADLAWTPDGGSIVFSSDRAGTFSLWRLSLSNSSLERLMLGAEDPFVYSSSLSISRQQHRLAYTQEFMDSNIWRMDLPGFSVHGDSPIKLISSTAQDSGPHFSPDGKEIAFESTRSGRWEIWRCDNEGSNAFQITSLSTMSGAPRWSPDGRQIAFDSVTEGQVDIYIMGMEGGLPRRLTTETSDEVVSSWSRDGQWIYFASNRSGTWQVWKSPSQGGKAEQVTQKGGFASFESPDRKFLYYAKGLTIPGLWRVPVEGGEEKSVLDLLKAGYWGYWAVVEEGIYLVNPDVDLTPALEFFSFRTGKMARIAVLEKQPRLWTSGLTVSPDGRTILYSQVDQVDSDIMLVENFR